MNKNVPLLLAGITLVAAGCTLAPKYDRPAAPVSDSWPKGPAYKPTPAAPKTPEAAQLKWRDFFTDKKLQQVIGTALENNRDLRIAALNVKEAQAKYEIQRAELLPTVTGAGDYTKQGIPAVNSSTGQRLSAEQYNASLGVISWEIDFFGRIRSLKGKALETFLATEEARRGAQILLVSSVAKAYLTLAADRENLKLAQTTVEAQQGSYNLVKRRYDLGIAQELDLYRAQTPVDTARRDVALYTQQVAQDENALNLLVGSPVPSELLPTALDRVSPPKEIASGLSSEVLLCRPDVLQAEDQLKAAYADIGAARAAFFPNVSLTSALGLASSDLSGLFKAGGDAWNFTPQVAMPIFDARTWPALKVTKVQKEIAVAQYEKAIQEAFREVADALAVHGTVNQQLAEQQSLVNALAETYRLSLSRYDKGIDNYLGVLDAQRSLFAAQQALVYLRLSKHANQVKLYAVLGGGWQAE